MEKKTRHFGPNPTHTGGPADSTAHGANQAERPQQASTPGPAQQQNWSGLTHAARRGAIVTASTTCTVARPLTTRRWPRITKLHIASTPVARRTR
jgi:hypothetical protein